jgi:hypothetical protein
VTARCIVSNGALLCETLQQRKPLLAWHTKVNKMLLVCVSFEIANSARRHSRNQAGLAPQLLATMGGHKSPPELREFSVVEHGSTGNKIQSIADRDA